MSWSITNWPVNGSMTRNPQRISPTGREGSIGAEEFCSCDEEVETLKWSSGYEDCDSLRIRTVPLLPLFKLTPMVSANLVTAAHAFTTVS